MQTDNVVVRKSKINGKGVFAARIFKRGEVVLKWDTSHRLSRKVVETFSNDEKKYLEFAHLYSLK